MTNGFERPGVLAIVAVTSCGLIAGQMLAIAISKHAARALPETSWTASFQLDNKLFTRTMPFALMIPLLALVASCIFIPGHARRWYVAATAMLAVVLAITMMANVPINNQVGAWRPGGAPAGWAAVRDRWLVYHDLRTSIGVLSLIFTSIAVDLH